PGVWNFAEVMVGAAPMADVACPPTTKVVTWNSIRTSPATPFAPVITRVYSSCALPPSWDRRQQASDRQTMPRALSSCVSTPPGWSRKSPAWQGDGDLPQAPGRVRYL